MGGGGGFTQNFGWEPEGKRPLRRPRHRWEDIIKLYLMETGWDRDQWQAPVNTIMNLQVPLKLGNFFTS
jgi:hypothetical protein